VREAFADGRSKNVPTILFMDEIDAIAETRSDHGYIDGSMRVLATYRVELKRNVAIGTENMANYDI